MRKPRRFQPPWTVEEQAACFVVRDHTGQQLPYIYFEDEPGRPLSSQVAFRKQSATDRGELCRLALFPTSRAKFLSRPT
jgi:hypothetical protein